MPLPTVRILHHISEASFRRFEPFLTLAVRKWPEETSWDVGALRESDPDIKIGPATFVARFRDAIVSLRRFSWSPTTVDLIKLNSEEMVGKYCLALQPGTNVVWFKHRAPKGRTPDWKHLADQVNQPEAPAQASARVVPFGDATPEELRALCLLISNGKLEGPFHIISRVDEVSAGSLMATYNVNITWDERSERTIIL